MLDMTRSHTSRPWTGATEDFAALRAWIAWRLWLTCDGDSPHRAMTQQRLADLIGTSDSSISNAKNRKGRWRKETMAGDWPLVLDFWRIPPSVAFEHALRWRDTAAGQAWLAGRKPIADVTVPLIAAPRLDARAESNLQQAIAEIETAGVDVHETALRVARGMAAGSAVSVEAWKAHLIAFAKMDGFVETPHRATRSAIAMTPEARSASARSRRKASQT